MTDQTPIPGTALALPEPTALAAMLRDPAKVDTQLDLIEKEVRSYVPDVSTAKGRDAIKSLAFKVTRSKTAWDDAGKAANETARKQINVVDAERRKIRERLDALRDEARKPLTDWEDAEKARVDALVARLDVFKPATVPTESGALKAMRYEIDAISIDESWQEYRPQAASEKAACLGKLDDHITAAMQREELVREQARKDAELEELRAEKVRRDEADRLRAEADAAAEAERQAAAKREQDRLDAEAKEKRDAEEAEARAAQGRRDLADRLIAHIEAAGRGTIDGKVYPYAMLIPEIETRVLRDMQGCGDLAAEVEAVRVRVLADLREAKTAEDAYVAEQARLNAKAAADKAEQDAKAREQAAAQAERDRLAQERRDADKAAARRAADKEHRLRIRDDIATSLNAFCDAAAAVMIADAILDAKIAHVGARL